MHRMHDYLLSEDKILKWCYSLYSGVIETEFPIVTLRVNSIKTEYLCPFPSFNNKLFYGPEGQVRLSRF